MSTSLRAIVLAFAFACQNRSSPAEIPRDTLPISSPLEPTAPGSLDNDRDGYAADRDCDDTNPAVSPSAGEVRGDGIDNDCDETIDCDDIDLINGIWKGMLDAGDVEGFCEGYCTRDIQGSLVLSDLAASQIGDLSCVTAIGGDVNLSGTALSSLSGLESLETVLGSIYIWNSDALTSLSGLFAGLCGWVET